MNRKNQTRSLFLMFGAIVVFGSVLLLWLGVWSPLDSATFHVNREALKGNLQDLSKVLQTVKVIPYLEGNKFSGFKVQGIDEDSPLDHKGLQVGDVIERVDSAEMNGAGAGLQAFERLMALSTGQVDKVDVFLKRHGRPFVIHLIAE